jgi:hypothetical protein
LDNGNSHRGKTVQELPADTTRLNLELFPPYALEVNPDEGVWNHFKIALAYARLHTQEEFIDVL